jgi:hypothetical protein
MRLHDRGIGGDDVSLRGSETDTELIVAPADVSTYGSLIEVGLV